MKQKAMFSIIAAVLLFANPRYSAPADADANRITFTSTPELTAALSAAKAGDEIILQEGIYQVDPKNGYWKAFQAEADGTPAQHIILRSEDPEHPAVICGSTTESKCALYITGSYWEIRGLEIHTAQKGIFLAKSEHSIISGCEVHDIGDEAIHIIDDSSYNLVENCVIHDTGLLTPKYGEGVYIGSAKNATDYGFECHYNTVRGCIFGPNITADHVDIKEYTYGNTVEYCTFDGTGIQGENGGDSFVEIKGNNAVVRYNTGYRNGCEKQLYGFDTYMAVDGWGQNNKIYDNTLYLDTDECFIAKGWNCRTEVFRNHTEPAECTYSGNRFLEVQAYLLDGDVNEDGLIDRIDAQFLRDCLNSKPVPHISFQNADLNGDGKLNAIDLTVLKRKLLQNDTDGTARKSIRFRQEKSGKWRMSNGLSEKTVTYQITAEPGSVIDIGGWYWDPNTVNEETGNQGKSIRYELGTVTPDENGHAEVSFAYPADVTSIALEVFGYQDNSGKRNKDEIILDTVWTE